MIHIGAKAVGLDPQDRDPDSAYRAMLWTVARVRSAGDADFAARQRIIAHLRARGWRPGPAGRPGRRGNPRARLIHHLWNTLHKAEVVESEEGLGTWLKHNTASLHPQGTGWSKPEFLSSAAANQVIEQLKQWAGRYGIDWRGSV